MVLANALPEGVRSAAVSAGELIAPESLLGVAELVRVLVVGAHRARNWLPVRDEIHIVRRAGDLRPIGPVSVHYVDGEGRKFERSHRTHDVKGDVSAVWGPDRACAGAKGMQARAIGSDGVDIAARRTERTVDGLLEKDRSAVVAPGDRADQRRTGAKVGQLTLAGP